MPECTAGPEPRESAAWALLQPMTSAGALSTNEAYWPTWQDPDCGQRPLQDCGQELEETAWARLDCSASSRGQAKMPSTGTRGMDSSRPAKAAGNSPKQAIDPLAAEGMIEGAEEKEVGWVSSNLEMAKEGSRVKGLQWGEPEVVMPG